MKKILKNWSPVFLYASLIFVGSCFSVQVPEGPDKILHALEFTLMGFFTTRAVLLTWNLPRLWALVLGAALAGSFGALDEIHQAFVPGRTSSVYDALADLSGGVLGALIFLTIGSLVAKKMYSDCHDKCCPGNEA